MATAPPPSSNLTGAQKDAYVKQYGGSFNGSQYVAGGTAPVAPKPATTVVPAPKPVATTAPVAPKPPVAAAPAPKPATTAAGWKDVGNGMMLNPTTGQRLSTASPQWKAIAGAGTGPAFTGGPVAVSEPAPANSVAKAGAGAQTYSTTPGAGPDQTTTNQGTQDVLRNTYLQRVLQPQTIDANDPAIRQQSDSFSAAAERARRDASADLAEQHAGVGDSGAQNVEQRSINEKAAQARGTFESQLVGQQLQARKDEINDAMQQLGGMLSGDQQRALQEELAKINQQLQQSQIASNEKLGMGSINVDLARALLQNQQANKSLGLQAGTTAAQLNQQALLAAMGM